MNPATAHAESATPPLIQRLIDDYGYPVLGAADIDALPADDRVNVLFFTEDPKKYPETLDVAVVLPELVAHYGERLHPVIVARADERALQERYGFAQWPTLVFLHGRNYLGAISRIQDWHVYLERIDELLTAEPTRPPGVGVPVVGA